MDSHRLMAFCAHRQGLDGSLSGATAEEVLARTGWARSIGSCNPYLTVFARSGLRRAQVEAEASAHSIQELPCARGCTYVLPHADFGLGLALARGARSGASDEKAIQKLGVPDAEIKALAEAVVGALAAGPLDPKALKAALGEQVRHLGEEGKKRGLTTTLPVALGRLQEAGRIRRVPEGGRLDHERYAYEIWDDAPALVNDATAQIAARYWHWTGIASLKQFQWFTGFGVAASKSATAGLELEPLENGSPLLIRSCDRKAWKEYEAPREPDYRLVASLDGATLLRRDVASLVAEEDRSALAAGEGLTDLPSHAILDRGRLIGLWEFDFDAGEIVWNSWAGRREALRAAVAATESYVRDELGDARGYSLDSPKSRAERVAALRATMAR
jgi:hypothetical protein